MAIIITIAAELFPSGSLHSKKSGRPTSAPQLKQMSCRFVRFNRTLLFTRFRSVGIETYAI